MDSFKLNEKIVYKIRKNTDDDLYPKIYGIVKNTKTGNELIDRFFREEFMVDSGMWIRRHPELDKLKLIYETLRRK